MPRVGTLFITICMALIAGSAGAISALQFGFGIWGSGGVALAVLLALVLLNLLSTRTQSQGEVSPEQFADLSNGTADLARQVIAVERRLMALEAKVDKAAETSVTTMQALTDPLTLEMSQLSALVQQLAETVVERMELEGPVQSAESRDGALDAQQTFASAGASHDAEALTALSATALEAAVAVALEGGTLEQEDADHERQAQDEQTQVERAQEEHATEAGPQGQAEDDDRQDRRVAAVSLAVVPARATGAGFLGQSAAEQAAVIHRAIDANRFDVYLQPIVTLPQRKVRFYEAVARLRTENGEIVPAADFISRATAVGVMPKVDRLQLFRCVQIVRRLQGKHSDIGLFCNISGETLADTAVFGPILEFLEANRAIADSLLLEFTQATWRTLDSTAQDNLATLADCGYRFSLDNITDLNLEPRDLAQRHVRYLKVAGEMLLERPEIQIGDIDRADLANLLARYGISLIADRIESENIVVDLLDHDLRYGQGFVFSQPRPVRAEALQPVNEDETAAPPPPPTTTLPEAPAIIPQVRTLQRTPLVANRM